MANYINNDDNDTDADTDTNRVQKMCRIGGKSVEAFPSISHDESASRTQ